MIFANKRILIMVSVIAVALAVLGFSMFGRLDREPADNAVIVNDTSKPPVDKVDESSSVGDSIPVLTSSPATGPETLAFLFLASAGIIGWNLRRYSHP